MRQRFDTAVQAPLWSEVQKEIGNLEKALREKEEEQQQQLQRADEAAASGGAGTRKDLEKAALLSAALSGSRLRRLALEAVPIGSTPTALGARGARSSATGGCKRALVAAGSSSQVKRPRKKVGGKGGQSSGVGVLFSGDGDGEVEVEWTLAQVLPNIFGQDYSPGRELKGDPWAPGRVVCLSGCSPLQRYANQD